MPMGNRCDKNDMDQCYPLKGYGDVLFWSPPEYTNWAQLVKPLNKRAKHCFTKYSTCGREKAIVDSSKRPKTLVCHDMKGGYLEDRYVNGHSDLCAYKYISWSCIDTFVYFSHEFITIPPLAWINAGHTHGVKVLGTIITEGEPWSVHWRTLSKDHSLLEKLAKNLSLICKYYGFDGYLLNIEVKLETDIVRCSFRKFISSLYNHLKDINPAKLLIWYDSITYDGKLEWQNKLNEKNRPFFDLCDGIFLNYCWNEEFLKESVKNAGPRRYDVYVGVDVFGRGCPGGGGFSSCEALKLIRKHDLSAAIFAPGWVHEKCEENENPDCRDFKFWSLISEYLDTHGPSVLPFETSFCRGYGQRRNRNGWLMRDGPWFNMSEMNHQPGVMVGMERKVKDDEIDNCCIKYYDEESFTGGGCLLITQSAHGEDHIDWILVCDFSTDPESYRIIIEVLTRPFHSNDVCEMELIVSTGIFIDDVAQERFHNYHIRQNNTDKKVGWFRSAFNLDLGSEHILRMGFKLTGDCKPILVGNIHVFEDFTL